MLKVKSPTLTRVWPLTTQTVAMAFVVALVAALAALPTVSAEASPTPSGILTPVAVTTFGSGEVEAVLSGLPLEDVSAEQLSELLAQLPGLSTLPSEPLQESLQKSIEALAGKGDTLGQLDEPTELVSDLGTQLGKLLSIGELLSLLKGQSLTTVLTNGLGSLPSTSLLGQLLGSSAHPEQLIEQLLATLDPTTLEGLLGSTLTGDPFSRTTVGELATQLGTTAEGLVTALGTTTSQLPATAMALTAPLSNGKLLSVLDGLGGVSLSLLTPSHEETTPEESAKGSGGEGGSGGTGSSGGSPQTTPTGTTVVIESLASPSSAAVAMSAPAPRSSIKILRKRIKGHRLTLVVQVSGPGAVSVAGKGLRGVSLQVAKAERLTMHTTLTKARAASARRHDVKVSLRLSFKPFSEASAVATTAVVFR